MSVFTQMYGAVLDGRLDSAEPRTPETTTHTSFRSFAKKVLLPAIAAAGGAAASKQQSQA